MSTISSVGRTAVGSAALVTLLAGCVVTPRYGGSSGSDAPGDAGSVSVGLAVERRPAAGVVPAVRYRLSLEEPASGIYHVEAELPATGEETLVSLPARSPGNHTIHDYARKVRTFEARAVDGTALDWDKLDKDTWRIASGDRERVRVSYEFVADSAHVSGSVLREEFGFFNGTNLFLYPETGYDFASRLRIELPRGWRIATELEQTGEPGVFRADDYHELVDRPTFLGHFGMDSVRVDGVWIRLAVHPAEHLHGEFGGLALDVLGRVGGYYHDFFGDRPPYDSYTALVYLASEPLSSAGGLEHADSHLDVLPARFAAAPGLRPLLERLLAHEYFHAWNVKRIRPAELWSYDYARAQFTPLLWFSEGVTDYYADLALVRTGVWSEEQFWESLSDAAAEVDAAGPASVEDASVDTWMEPIYLPDNYHYDKGKLIGLLLDAAVRDATDGAESLDDVVRDLYREHYLEGRGFTTDDLRAYLGARIGEGRVRAFHRRYIDGREPLPCDSILRRIGVEYVAETVTEPSLGVGMRLGDEGRLVVERVLPGSTGDGAGLRPGDALLRLGEVTVEGPASVDRFYRLYGDRVGTAVGITYRRDGERMTGRAPLRTRERRVVRIEPDPGSGERARRLRAALLAR